MFVRTHTYEQLIPEFIAIIHILRKIPEFNAESPPLTPSQDVHKKAPASAGALVGISTNGLTSVASVTKVDQDAKKIAKADLT